MYSTLPSLVLAFHGCDKQTHDLVLYENKTLKPSRNDYDWLGWGVYFWEQNYDRALLWAKEQASRNAIQEPSVIGAVIDLGRCLNLTDSRYIELLSTEYELLSTELASTGADMPVNSGSTEDMVFRRLDCAVIEHLHARLRQKEPDSLSEPFDSARGLFSEGKPIYEGAGFNEKTHVQICVRNPNCIKGYFEPRKPDRQWRLP